MIRTYIYIILLFAGCQIHEKADGLIHYPLTMDSDLPIIVKSDLRTYFQGDTINLEIQYLKELKDDEELRFVSGRSVTKKGNSYTMHTRGSIGDRIFNVELLSEGKVIAKSGIVLRGKSRMFVYPEYGNYVYRDYRNKIRTYCKESVGAMYFNCEGCEEVRKIRSDLYEVIPNRMLDSIVVIGGCLNRRRVSLKVLDLPKPLLGRDSTGKLNCYRKIGDKKIDCDLKEVTLCNETKIKELKSFETGENDAKEITAFKCVCSQKKITVNLIDGP